MQNSRDFPGGPLVKSPRFQCRGYGFDPWLGNEDPTRCMAQPNKLKVKELKTVTKMIMTDPTFAKQLITNKAPCEPQNNLMNQSK